MIDCEKAEMVKKLGKASDNIVKRAELVDKKDIV
jgi:hypothetical protein